MDAGEQKRSSGNSADRISDNTSRGSGPDTPEHFEPESPNPIVGMVLAALLFACVVLVIAAAIHAGRWLTTFSVVVGIE